MNADFFFLVAYETLLLVHLAWISAVMQLPSQTVSKLAISSLSPFEELYWFPYSWTVVKCLINIKQHWLSS